MKVASYFKFDSYARCKDEKAIKIALIITIIAAMSLTGAFIVWKKRLASKVGLLNKAGKKEPKVKEKTEK